MNIATVYFLASFIGIIAMVYLKARELRYGRKSIFSSLTQRTDRKIYSIYIKVRRFFSYFNKRSAIALVQWIAYHILLWTRNGYVWVRAKAHAHPPSKKVIDMVRGRGEIDRNGGTSFYLKKISKEG